MWTTRTTIECTKQKSVKQRITRAEHRYRRDLRLDNTIKILSADEGNPIVLMDVQTYKNKIQDVLRAEKYKKLSKIPQHQWRTKYTRLSTNAGKFSE